MKDVNRFIEEVYEETLLDLLKIDYDSCEKVEEQG